MALRYFVGTPEDAFRKHDIVFHSVQAADHYQVPANANTLLVYKATSTSVNRKLILVLDLDDVCNRFNRTYKGDKAFKNSIYIYFERFVEKLLRFRRVVQMKEAA
jgi:hypothetical protein